MYTHIHVYTWIYLYSERRATDFAYEATATLAAKTDGGQDETSDIYTLDDTSYNLQDPLQRAVPLPVLCPLCNGHSTLTMLGPTLKACTHVHKYTHT